jgi:hypothetical protein
VLLKKLDSEFNDELYSDMRQSLSWNYTHGVFKMLSRDWGTGKDVCERVAARTLLIAAGRQDIVCTFPRLVDSSLRTLYLFLD